MPTVIDPSPAPWQPSLHVRDLTYCHGAQITLDHITLDLEPGRHYVIAGPNGAGKSTLLDLLCRLKRPHSGEILIENSHIAEFSPRSLSRIIALAPQEYSLDFPFSIREVTAMGRRPHIDRWGRLQPTDKEAVNAALRAVHLDSIAHKPVTALSGGERRRCVAARAIAQDTPIIIFDEPDSGLDIAQALTVMALAKNLAEQGRLVVTVSHDLNLAARYGHYLIFLRQGRVVAHGPVAEVFTGAVLSKVYQTEARVSLDHFTGAPVVAFRLGCEPMTSCANGKDFGP